MTQGAIFLLLKTNITDLLESGWEPPMSFSVKARDGETDLYGMLFKPFDFDPAKNVWQHKFEYIDISGESAAVKVQLYKDDKHIFTDYHMYIALLHLSIVISCHNFFDSPKNNIL